MSAEHIKELTTQAFLIGDLAQQCGPATFWVKQLKVDKIDERSRKLLAQCFPGFDGMAAVSKFYKQSGVRFEVTSKGTLRTETGRLRRYAGNKELPGGRYYSVCKDSSGNDDGTMVFELMSYWSSESKKFPELIDSTVHIEAAKSYRQTIADPNRHFLVLKATDIVSFDKNEIKLGDSTAIILPLEIYQLELTRAVDLRLPVIQDFFTFIFARLETVYGLGGYNKMGGEAMNVMQKKELPDFKSLLPTLVTPQPGGTSFLDFIGAICRNCEVDGLIFPSARRDVFVEHLKDHGIQSFSGWNFVDYRAAGAVDATAVLELLGLQVQWLTANHVGVQIEWDDTELHRRWRIHGAESGERNRYRIEWEIMMGQKVPNPSWTPWFAGRERNLRQ